MAAAIVSLSVAVRSESDDLREVALSLSPRALRVALTSLRQPGSPRTHASSRDVIILAAVVGARLAQGQTIARFRPAFARAQTRSPSRRGPTRARNAMSGGRLLPGRRQGSLTASRVLLERTASPAAKTTRRRTATAIMRSLKPGPRSPRRPLASAALNSPARENQTGSRLQFSLNSQWLRCQEQESRESDARRHNTAWSWLPSVLRGCGGGASWPQSGFRLVRC
jgi:hypothetical protein